MLDGNVAVVTGAGQGIGRAVALDLARSGAKVIVNDIDAALAEQVVAEIATAGGQAFAVVESVATMEGGRAIVQAALDTFGALNAVICNAGILRPASIFDLTEAEWDEVLSVNLKGHFSVIQPAARQMRAQQSGSIIVFTSSGGLEGSPKQPNYAASKEGILGLMRSVALQLAPYATCNAVSPSALTRMLHQMRPGHVPGTPEDIAPLVTFLASDKARHITGQVLGVAGQRVSIFPQPKVVRSAFATANQRWTAECLADIWESSLGTEPLLRYERFVGKV